MIPDSFKQDLLNRVDIVDVVQRAVQLKKAGANYIGLCPFHSEKTPSFTVSPAKQFYHCFGCQKHGNAIGFLMEYAGLGYVDALKELAAGVGMQLPEWRPRTPEEAKRQEREVDLYAVMRRALEYYRAELKKSPRAIEYLKHRGLDGRTAARFGIGYAPDDWQGLKAAFPDYDDKALVECGLVIEQEGKRYDRFRDRVMFPIFNRRDAPIGFGGRVLGEGEPKYLNSPETPLFEKGRELYGLGHARDAIHAARRVLVVEGYMDVVALAQHGVEYAVATLGTATTPVHVTKLLKELRENGAELVFCFDGDAAGRKAAWRALEVSLPLATDATPIRFLFLPEADDPDSFVRQQGREAFEKRVLEAQALSAFLIGELRLQSDMATPEGGSRLLAAAKPHLQRIAAPALRLLILKEIAKLAGVSQEEATELLQLGAKANPARPAPARRPAKAPSRLEWKLLSLVAAAPALAARVDPANLDETLPESQALREIAAWCADKPQQGERAAAQLIEHFQAGPYIELISGAQAFALELDRNEDEVRGEFEDILAKLAEQRRKDELDEGLKKGRLTLKEWQERRAQIPRKGLN